MGRKTVNLVIFLFAIACGVLGTITAFNLYGRYGDWTIVVAIGTWVSTFIVGLGIGFGFLQLRESRLGTNAQIAMDIYNELHNKESLETLRFIYELNPDNPAIVYNSDKYRIEYLLDRYNLLALLVKNGIVDRDLAIDTYAGVSVLKCWYVLHKFIYDMREIQKRKSYCYPFEGFTHLCMENFKRRGIEAGFESSYYKDSNRDNLVSEFQSAKEDKDKEKKKLYPRSWDKIEKDWKNKQNQQTSKGVNTPSPSPPSP